MRRIGFAFHRQVLVWNYVASTCQWLMGTTPFGRKTRVGHIDRNERYDSLMGVDHVKIDANHYEGEEYLAPKDMRLGNRNSTFLLL